MANTASVPVPVSVSVPVPQPHLKTSVSVIACRASSSGPAGIRYLAPNTFSAKYLVKASMLLGDIAGGVGTRWAQAHKIKMI